MQDKEISALVAPVVTDLGYDFIGLECVPMKTRPLIRVYVDKTGGISVDECATVSRSLNPVLSVESKYSDYRLEVSSPGMDRKLFNLEQCKGHVGSVVDVQLALPLNGRRHYKGKLSAVIGDDLSLEVEGENVVISFVDILHLRIVPQW